MIDIIIIITLFICIFKLLKDDTKKIIIKHQFDDVRILKLGKTFEDKDENFYTDEETKIYNIEVE